MSARNRLARRLGTADAVVIGLGAMIGAGVFSAFGPAARAAGNGLWIGLGIAAVVAYGNATSSAQLAAIYPESGGAYVYGRERLGEFWGFIAGWAFVAGKLASCAAMAMTFGSYAWPSHARSLAFGAVITATAINYVGIQKTAIATRVVVALVIGSLSFFVVAVWLGGAADPSRTGPLRDVSLFGVLQAAGFLFFAFAGYARIATLGEEVVDPARTIPRAIPIALAIALVVYAVVAFTALSGAGAEALAASPAPLVTAIEKGRFSALSWVLRAGAAIASAGVLLSLIAGISRTVFAMASNGDAPRFFAAVHPRFSIPHRAEIAVGAVLSGAVLVADLRAAIGFSSFCVLTYYGIANAAALTLKRSERRWPAPLAVMGLAGCAAIACALPWTTVTAGAIVLAIGAGIWKARTARGV